MAAHFEDAHVFAFDFQRFSQVLLGDLHPLADRWLGQHFARGKVVFHLAEYPRAPVGRAADHHAVHAVAVEHFGRFRPRIHIAVADDRDMYPRIVLHLADQRPVGFAAVHLGPCAAVYRERRDADILQAQGYLLDVLRLVVPAQAGFHGHGFPDRFHDPPRHFDHQRHVAHHARSGAPPRDLLHGAAEVDVDDVRAGRFGHARRLDHRFDQMAVELDAHRTLRVVDFEFFERLGRIAYQPVGRDEFRVNHVGAEPLAHVAERRVGHVLHRRQQQGFLPEFYVGNFHDSPAWSCVTSILSMRTPSMSTISRSKLFQRSFSPVAGMCFSWSRTSPLIVL